MNDEEIIGLLERRDEKGLAELSKKLSQLIRKVCRGILASRTDAEDCENDTLLAVWNAIPPDRPDNLAAYVCKIARRKSINRLRSSKSPIRNPDLLAELDECIPSACSVESAAETAELIEALDGWLDTLGEKHKQLFIERYFYAQTIKDAARECSMSLTAATTALSRMRASLKVYLNERSLL